MKLYIQIENGQPTNHPALEDNLIQAFGAVPAHWEPFTRVERPTPGVYQVLESNEAVYAKVDGVWADVWSVREMTAEEKTALQQSVRDAFAAREQAENWAAWTLDEATCTMQPPIPRPEADEAKLAQRMIQLKLNLVDVSAAQSKVLSSPASMSQPWTDQTLATELAKQSGAKVAITGVGKLVRDPATGNPTRVTFTLRAFDTQSATLLGATSVYRDLNSGSLTFNQSIDELVAEATGRIVGQLSDAWGR
jgi:hypothetical protein